VHRRSSSLCLVLIYRVCCSNQKADAAEKGIEDKGDSVMLHLHSEPRG
jgi:hypothetical protein